MKVVGSRYTSMRISMEVGGSRSTYKEPTGSFPGKTWKFPPLVEVEASIASFYRTLQQYILWKLPCAFIPSTPLHISTYSHEYQKLPAASTTLTPNPNPNPKLEELLALKLDWGSMEVDEVTE